MISAPDRMTARSSWGTIATLLMAIVTTNAVGQTPPDSWVPLTDLGESLYLDQFSGGLYPEGSNDVPQVHSAAGIARALAVEPLNALGQVDPDGKQILLSIGMSNTTREFLSFIAQAAAHSAVNHSSLVVVDGAAGGSSAAAWDSPTDSDYGRIVAEKLVPNGLSELQVQAAWVKVANPGPSVALPSQTADAFRLVSQMGDISRALKIRYPNLQLAFFSSRIYAGYASTSLNPEPFAYESGFAVKWLIEAQLNQINGGEVDPVAGNLNYADGTAPWISWGPYLWADGLNPRSDGLIWEPDDFAADGTHPSGSGSAKVGKMLLEYLLYAPYSQPWFRAQLPGDYNGNGAIDAADYAAWLAALGGTELLNDPTPGSVDESDYAYWKQHFGETLAGNGSVDNAIPEPATQAILWLHVAATMFYCRNLCRRGRDTMRC